MKRRLNNVSVSHHIQPLEVHVHTATNYTVPSSKQMLKMESPSLTSSPQKKLWPVSSCERCKFWLCLDMNVSVSTPSFITVNSDFKAKSCKLFCRLNSNLMMLNIEVVKILRKKFQQVLITLTLNPVGFYSDSRGWNEFNGTAAEMK